MFGKKNYIRFRATSSLAQGAREALPLTAIHTCSRLLQGAQIATLRDRQSGGHLAVSHFQIRDGGIRGMALIQLPSFEDGDAQFSTVLRDNGTSAFALDGHPF
jgi:hypothetical protein